MVNLKRDGGNILDKNVFKEHQTLYITYLSCIITRNVFLHVGFIILKHLYVVFNFRETGS